MKQVILLLLTLTSINSPPPPYIPPTPGLAGGFNELAGKEKGDLEMS